MSERTLPVFVAVRNELRLSPIELAQMRRTSFEVPLNELAPAELTATKQPDLWVPQIEAPSFEPTYTKVPFKKITSFESAQGEGT